MKTMTMDCVCGTEVQEGKDVKVESNGTTYHFCSDECRRRFLGAAYDAGANPGAGSDWKEYLPLGGIVGFTVLSATLTQWLLSDGWMWSGWVHLFMGFFLVIFSVLKLLGLRDFADGFQTYDLLARAIPAYAYAWPFIELGLGVAYLAHVQPILVNALTLAFMAFSSIGKIRALAKDIDLELAWVVEDAGLAFLAAVMLLVSL
jgi:YHS domain-containing protein